MKRFSLVTTAFLLVSAAPAWAGARMAFVGPKSVYAKAGLRTDDEVVDIDGKAPTSAGEVGQFIYAVRGDGKTHHIRVLRNGGTIELKFR